MKGRVLLKPIKKRVTNAYFVSTISITLVLFLVGLLGFMLVNARFINQYIRENIGLTLVLDDDVRDVDLIQLQKQVSTRPEVKSATYVNAETAAGTLRDELGEDFISYLGYNPLNATIDIKLFSAYTNNDSLDVLEKNYAGLSHVKEVYYQRNLVDLINENSSKIGAFLLVLTVVMLLIFTSLISNTIRLSIYSKRFLINTMQLVGATRSFIRKPFVQQSLLCGLIGAFCANLLLAVLFYSYYSQFSDMFGGHISSLLMAIFVLVFVSGILISWLSTEFAVNRFLRMKHDELYY